MKIDVANFRNKHQYLQAILQIRDLDAKGLVLFRRAEKSFGQFKILVFLLLQAKQVLPT